MQITGSTTRFAAVCFLAVAIDTSWAEAHACAEPGLPAKSINVQVQSERSGTSAKLKLALEGTWTGYRKGVRQSTRSQKEELVPIFPMGEGCIYDQVADFRGSPRLLLAGFQNDDSSELVFSRFSKVRALERLGSKVPPEQYGTVVPLAADDPDVTILFAARETTIFKPRAAVVYTPKRSGSIGVAVFSCDTRPDAIKDGTYPCALHASLKGFFYLTATRMSSTCWPEQADCAASTLDVIMLIETWLANHIIED
jgi:hypothetical protein